MGTLYMHAVWLIGSRDILLTSKHSFKARSNSLKAHNSTATAQTHSTPPVLLTAAWHTLFAVVLKGRTDDEKHFKLSYQAHIRAECGHLIDRSFTACCLVMTDMVASSMAAKFQGIFVGSIHWYAPHHNSSDQHLHKSMAAVNRCAGIIHAPDD